MTMKIEGQEITTEDNYLDPVTYVPVHVNGNAGHIDCEPGVIIRISDKNVHVLYCRTRTVQATRPEDLIFG